MHGWGQELGKEPGSRCYAKWKDMPMVTSENRKGSLNANLRNRL